jgi:hypothetical protein
MDVRKKRIIMSYRQGEGPGVSDLVGAFVVVGVVGAFVFPIVFEQIEAAEVGQQSAKVAALWGILPEFMVLVTLLGVAVMAHRITA